MKRKFCLTAYLIILSLIVFTPASFAADKGILQPPPSLAAPTIENAARLYSAGNYPAAMKEYAGLIENKNFSDSLEVLFPYARTLSFAGKFDEALKYYEAARKIKSDDYDINFGYAQTCLWSGKYEKAAKIFKLMTDTNPNNIDAGINLSKTYYIWGKKKEAFAILNNIDLTHPDNTEVKVELATLLTWNEEYERAISIYEKMLKAQPGNIEAINNIAKILSAQGEYVKAIKYYERALKLKPDNLDAVIGSGQVLNMANSDFNAMEKVRQAKKINPEYKFISELENAILEKHKPGFNAISSKSEDSDKTIVTNKKISYKANIDLKTKIKLNFAKFDAKIDETNNTAAAENISLTIERYLSKYFKAIIFSNTFKLDHPQNGLYSKSFPGAGILWQKLNSCYILFTIDKGLLIDTPLLIQKRITILTRTVEFFYRFSSKTNLTANYSISNFSDTNKKVNYTVNFERDTAQFSNLRLYLGADIKNFTFQNTTFNGYYSPDKYNSGGLYYKTAYKLKKLTLNFKETFGNQKASGDSKRYINKEFSLDYPIGNSALLNFQYLRSNTAISSIAGYDYKFISFGFNYKW